MFNKSKHDKRELSREDWPEGVPKNRNGRNKRERRETKRKIKDGNDGR